MIDNPRTRFHKTKLDVSLRIPRLNGKLFFDKVSNKFVKNKTKTNHQQKVEILENETSVNDKP